MLVKGRFLATIALFVFLTNATPVNAAALTQAQIDSILGLLQSFGAGSTTIANVEAALTGSPNLPAASSCSFARDLDIGAEGSDVSCLQQSLIAQGYAIAAGATGYFGAQTQAALAAYQKTQGISPALGYFGPLTRTKVSSSASGSSSGTTVTPGAPSVLAPGTIYTRIRSAEPEEEEEEENNDTPADTTAPTFSAISEGTPGTYSTTITWTTNEASNSRVEFGSTTSYGTVESDSTMTTSHSVVVDNLIAGRTYHFRVSSTDAAGNVASSSDDTFVADKFAAGAKLTSVGDSIMQFEHIATTLRLENQADGELTWARLRSPNFRHEVWYDDTNTTANDRMSIYGDTTGSATGDILFSGANLGYAGDTATGILSRTTAALNTTADIIVYAAGTNVGTTDSSVATTEAAIESAIDTFRAAGKGVVLATIRPRRVAASPTGTQISPASMDRIVEINDWIRANAERMGAVLWDPWDDLRDPAYGVNDDLYGTDLSGVTRDNVHLTPLGAWLSSETLSTALDSMIDSGTWFNSDPTNSNLLAAGAFSGSGGTVGGGMTGTLTSGASILNVSGNGQPVYGRVSMENNSETGGNSIVIVATSTGLGTANTFQTIRLSFSNVTTGFSASDYVSGYFEVEVASSSIRPAFQATLGSSSVVYARGLGQTTGTYNSEPYPTDDLNGWIVTEPMLVGTRPNLNLRFDLSVRPDAAGTSTVKIKRAFLRTVTDPTTLFPWDPD